MNVAQGPTKSGTRAIEGGGSPCDPPPCTFLYQLPTLAAAERESVQRTRPRCTRLTTASNTIAPTNAVIRYMNQLPSSVRNPVTFPIALPIRPPITPTTMFHRIPIDASRFITMLASPPAMPPRIIVAIQPMTQVLLLSAPVVRTCPNGTCADAFPRPAMGVRANSGGNVAPGRRRRQYLSWRS